MEGLGVDAGGLSVLSSGHSSERNCPGVMPTSFGGNEVARNLEKDLKTAGKSAEIHIYAGTNHAFVNDTRPDVYDAKYAKTA